MGRSPAPFVRSGLSLYHGFLLPLRDVPGIGPRLQSAFARRGIENVGELLLHLPSKWIDDRDVLSLAHVRPGQVARVRGVIVAREFVSGRGCLRIQLRSQGDMLRATFFHARHLLRDARLQVGQEITLRGELSLWRGQWQMTHPDWQAWASFAPAIVPHYPMLAGKGTRALRRLIGAALRLLPEDARSPLDARIDGMPLRMALQAVHCPSLDQDDAWRRQAVSRIKREELYVYRALMHRRKMAADCEATAFAPGCWCERLLARFPAPLSDAQQQAWRDIAADLRSGRRMHRLLQGDVGSGKTWLAALAACCPLERGAQVAFMAPTGVLARQHYETLRAWLADWDVDVEILTGGMRASERKRVCNRLREDGALLVVGTHALIGEDVRFRRLGLAIVDEQHRFGVRQRWALAEKGEGVHLLAMSATPIPRSLAMGLYGDLDLTIMRGMPPGRKAVDTRILSQARLAALYAGMRRILDAGGRIYWVVPRVEEEAASVSRRVEDMRRNFPDARAQGLHGRMKVADKQRILASFASGECRLLVSTTVIEVGVHVPEARLIVIEHADRYGLAQLHQLRGRVGRDGEQGYCVLLASEAAGATSIGRLRAMLDCHDGMALAERDLLQRGAGDWVGLRQSGDLAFRLFDPLLDAGLLIEWEQEFDHSLDTMLQSFWRPVSATVD